MTQDQTRDLRATIAAADPAADTPGLRADQTIALTQQAVAAAQMTPLHRSPRRPLMTGILAGSAVAIVAIVAAIAIPLSNTPAPEPMTLEQVPGGTSAKCIAPDAAMLAQSSDMMFRADVSGISDGIVTLDVTAALVGDPGSVVEVAQGDGLISDGGPLVFEDGATYLLATSDGVILSCGLSGIASPELESIYAEAADLP
jgi:hypothetical protein